MIPILYEYNETSFMTHGIGDLVDCIECKTSQNDEGEYELSFTYPVSGKLLKELTIGRLVYAKANPWQDNQIFRIYGYEKAINGILTVNCQHISYDLANIPIRKFKCEKADSCDTALTKMKQNAVPVTGLNINQFAFYSDVSGTAQRTEGFYELETPSSARAVLLDGDDSIKGMFGGDLVLDNYRVSLLKLGGADRGTLIEYGVDLMDLNQEESISEMFTGVLPYYTYTLDDDENTEQITYGAVQYVSGTFLTQKIFPLDLTTYYPNQKEHTSPTASELEAKAREWMAAEKGFGEPEVNLTLSYAALGQDVRLHDAVTVRFVKMGIDVKSKVSSYTYDVLRERVTEVEVGNAKPSIIFSLEDASRLRKGLLPPERIKDNSLSSDKYGSGSVGGRAIGGSAVSSYHLKDGAVTTEKIEEEAVDTPQIKKLAITVNRIRDGAVITEKIADDAVITDKLLNDAVTYAKSHYKGTLDQVGINRADIAAINEIFAGRVWADFMYASNMMAGTMQANEMYVRGSIVASQSWVRNNFMPR